MIRATKSDVPRINYILSKDEIFQSSIDDNFPMKHRWNIGTLMWNNKAYITLPNELCVFMALPSNNSIIYEPHVAVMPECRGKEAVSMARDSIVQFFDDMPQIHKLVGYTPIHLRAAVAFSRMVGFKKEGVCTKSFLKDGKLYDQYISGFSREEVTKWL